MDAKNIKKIAIFRALKVGDMTCAIPAIRAIRKNFPNAQITLISLPWANNFAIRFDKYIDKFVEFPGYPGLPEREVDWARLSKFVRDVKKENYDILFQMQGNGTVVNPFLKKLNAKNFVGYYKEEADKFTDHTYKYPENIHEVNRWLMLVEKVTGQKEDGNDVEFNIMDYERKFTSLLMSFYKLQDKSFIVLHPGGSEAQKRISPKVFVELGNYFSSLGHKIVLTGNKEEKLLCNKIANGMSKKAINLAGATTLGVVGEIIRKSRLFISNDTGVAHIASAFDTPSIVLFNENSDLQRWAPLDRLIHRSVVVRKTSTKEILFEAFKLLGKKTYNRARIYGSSQ